MKRFYYFSLLLATVVSSCSPGRTVRYLKDTGSAVERQVSYKKQNKEVILLPLPKVTKPALYDEAKAFVNQKKAEGYTVYYEGIDSDNFVSLTEKEIALKKVRKALRYTPNYSNKESAWVHTKKLKKNRTPFTYAAIGINKATDKNINFTLQDFITRLESQGFDLTLTSYDHNTPLESKYKAKQLKPLQTVSTHEIILQDVAQKLAEAPEHKILLVYDLHQRQRLTFAMKKVGFEDNFYTNYRKKL